MPPIKIVHVISDLHTGGAQSMLYKIVTHMDRTEFEHHIVSLTNPGVIGEQLVRSGFSVEYLRMKRGVPNPIGLMRLVRILRRVHPRIVQGWLYHGDLMGLAGAKLSGSPVLLWNVRQSFMNRENLSTLSRFVVWVLAFLSHLPQAILVNSQTGKSVHAAFGYRPKRWMYIPNGFDLNQYQPDPSKRTALRATLGVSKDAPIIGLVARFHPMKDHQTFLEAAHQLMKIKPSVHYVLVGPQIDWSNAELSQLVMKLNLNTRIHLLGDRSDIADIMPAFDIYTSSSAFGEGFSNAIGEALACAVPCVVTNVGDSPHIVGETGIIIPARDPLAMAAAWQSLLENPGDLRARGNAARKRMEKFFEIQKIADSYAEVYRSFM